MLEIIWKRKKKWIGHILKGESLVKDVLEGKLEGQRGRGRPPIMLLDYIKNRDSYAIIKRRASDREKWREWVPRTCPWAEH